jgi:hypothetical protein
MKYSTRIGLALGALLAGAVAMPPDADARGGGGRRGGGRGKGGKEYKDRKAMILELEAQLRVSDRELRFQKGRDGDAGDARTSRVDKDLRDLRQRDEDARRGASFRVESPL